MIQRRDKFFRSVLAWLAVLALAAAGCSRAGSEVAPIPIKSPTAVVDPAVVDPAVANPTVTAPVSRGGEATNSSAEASLAYADPATKPTATKAAEPMLKHPFPKHFPAPSLDGGVDWINAAGPIDLKDLKGKFVVLDFWTYCCINCMHILPELKKLEKAYPNEVVVIGVHSAKFTAEEDSQNIREAVERYEIEHPVVNDAQHKIWQRFQVESWPSLRLIDPEGNLVAAQSGEIEFTDLDALLKFALPYYRQRGLLNLTPLHFDLESAKAQATPLRYPGKILADEKSGRLFIADSNHNRLAIARLDGTLVDTIGSGALGTADGDYATAQFNHPQGMALAGDTLYVADTENHLLRKVDLQQKKVVTVAGTGKQSRNPFPGPGGDDSEMARRPAGGFVGAPLKTPLSSPWDLCVQGTSLFIAMAGSHQIWKMPLDESTIGLYAGNAREDIVDGPLLPDRPYQQGFCSFAQPSGLASDGTTLFVVDSEGASIRGPMDPKQKVRTLIGTAGLRAGRLFTFGDADGHGDQVQYQHPLGLAYGNGKLFLADTYNHKIKVIDPDRLTSNTLAGTGKAGAADQPAAFREPAGLSYAAGKLYVADTNNSLVRTIDLEHDNRVATLEIKGLEPPKLAKVEHPFSFGDATPVDVPAATAKVVDGSIRLQVALKLPVGYHLNPLAPMRYRIDAVGEGTLVDRPSLGKLVKLEKPATEFEITLPVAQADGHETLKVSLAYFYCQEAAAGVCKASSVTWTVPLGVGDAGVERVRLPFEVK